MKKLLFLSALLICFTGSKANTWTITGANHVFTPDSITISLGDTVVFQIDSGDNAQEVSQSTWLAGDSVPVTGFQTPQGGGTVTHLAPGVHYYVSDSSASIGMKGRIYALPPATVQFTMLYDSVLESVGTIPVIISVSNPSGAPVSFTLMGVDSISSARPDIDYLFNDVTFTDSGTSGLDTAYITIIDDQLIEPTQTIVLRLSKFSSNALPGADSLYTVYIIDNDTLTFSFLGAAFSYPQTVDTAFIGVTNSAPVPYVSSVTVVLDSGNAVKGVNFNCADTTVLIFPADSADTIYFPVQILVDTNHVGNTQVNFRLINPTNGALLGISAYTLFIIGNGVNGIAPDLALENNLKLFPNPVSEHLNIVSGAAWQKVLITDIIGNELMNIGELNLGKHEVDISALPAGIYMINFQNSQSSYCEKLIKIQTPSL